MVWKIIDCTKYFFNYDSSKKYWISSKIREQPFWIFSWFKIDMFVILSAHDMPDIFSQQPIPTKRLFVFFSVQHSDAYRQIENSKVLRSPILVNTVIPLFLRILYLHSYIIYFVNSFPVISWSVDDHYLCPWSVNCLGWQLVFTINYPIQIFGCSKPTILIRYHTVCRKRCLVSKYHILKKVCR